MEFDFSKTEYSAEASLELYNLLDRMGISDRGLKLHSFLQDLFDFVLSSDSLFSREESFGFSGSILAGSIAEGPLGLSILSGKESDVDILKVTNSCTLYENVDITNMIQNKNWQILMETCPKDSVYVRLKVIHFGNFLTFPTCLMALYDYDNQSGELYLTNTIPAFVHNAGNSITRMQSYLQYLQLASVFTNVCVSGPSFSLTCKSELLQNSFMIHKMDKVLAIPCPHWPNAAKEWAERHRKYVWPSQEFISQQVRGGCFVVPVGCKQCDKSHLDWRLSFTLTEKALIHSFNLTQLKCFLLLKYLKKNYFNNPNDAISSYVIKTSLFWTIEETPANLWRPHNLLTVVQKCLDKLIMFIHSDWCPNYFIRSSNLLVQRYNDEQKHALLQDCSRVRGHTLELLCKTAPFENTLQCRYIEQMPFQESSILDMLEDQMVSFLTCASTDFGICPKLWWRLSSQQTIGKAIQFCKETLTCLKEKMLQNTTPNSIALNNHIQTIVSDQLKKLLSTDCFQKKNNESKYTCHKVLSVKEDKKYLSSIVIDCHLLAAAGNYEICNKELKEIICNLKDKPHMRIPHPGKFFTGADTAYVELMSTMLTYFMDENIFEFPFIGDIFFTRFEIPVLPFPLQMEIYSDRGLTCQYDRSTGLGKTVIVDSLVYACFLRFWCCMMLDRNIEKLEARNDMVWVCSLPNISNKAVAFNLLGYCHNELEEYNNAFLAFCNALKQTPRSPATIIHIGAIINDKLWREWSETCPE